MSHRDDSSPGSPRSCATRNAPLHDGDAAPRRRLWSRQEPVSVLGAWRNTFGQQEIDTLVADLGTRFSDCLSCELEVLSYGLVGDVAYPAALEHTSASVDGDPRTYTLLATQVYRREGGAWRVAHRHGDTVTGARWERLLASRARPWCAAGGRLRRPSR